MITREQYLADRSPDAHDKYYSQFLTPGVFQRVASHIGTERLKESKDEHFNDIPLVIWDTVASNVPPQIDSRMRQAGDYPTKAVMVCVYKLAAKLIKNGEFKF